MSTSMLRILISASLLAACTAESAEDDPLAFPPLTADEAAQLPSGVDDHEHAAAATPSGPAQDDGATFDDDEPLPMIDVAQAGRRQLGKPTQTLRRGACRQ